MYQMRDKSCWVDGQTYLHLITPRGIVSLYFSNRSLCIPLKMITVATPQQSMVTILVIVYSSGYQKMVSKKEEPGTANSLDHLPSTGL